MFTESGGMTVEFSTLKKFASYIHGMHGCKWSKFARQANQATGKIAKHYAIRMSFAQDLYDSFPVID